MSYVALYRKYRPNTFESIVGQDNVTKILKNQIKNNKISHAYIFSGSRGTGKTSAAKIFARAINCLAPNDGEPCNECEVCKSILNGSTTDVVEMDAASNNSVENIRQIRQEVVYATVDVKYRVYIIDEAHMLTTSAFNALLKTLEEPPQNVVFILATTEQHKIPVTILSRCLRFDFSRISSNCIVDRLKYVLEQENMKYDIKALEFIAKLADGGLRDALSILDRCIVEQNNKLEFETIEKIIGTIDSETVNKIAESIYNLDSISALNYIDNVIQKGKDLRQLLVQLEEILLEKLILIDTDVQDKQKVNYIIDSLALLDNELKLSTNPEILFKSNICRICNYSYLNNNNSSNESSKLITELTNKIQRLEARIIYLEKGAVISSTNSNKLNNNQIIEHKLQVNNERSVPNISTNSNKINSNVAGFKNVNELKEKLVQKGKLKLYSAMSGVEIQELEDRIVIVTKNNFAYNILKSPESESDLKNIFKIEYNINKNISIELEMDKVDKSKLETLLQENNVDYTKID